MKLKDNLGKYQRSRKFNKGYPLWIKASWLALHYSKSEKT